MNELTRQRLTDLENGLMVAEGVGKDGERNSQGVWDGHVHTAIFKMDNQQGPPVQHRELCSNGMWQPGWKRGLGENGYTYMYG